MEYQVKPFNIRYSTVRYSIFSRLPSNSLPLPTVNKGVKLAQKYFLHPF